MCAFNPMKSGEKFTSDFLNGKGLDKTRKKIHISEPHTKNRMKTNKQTKAFYFLLSWSFTRPR